MRHALHRYVVPPPTAPASAPSLARWLALALALLACAGVAMAAGPAGSGGDGAVTTYRWVDAQGVVHYSDTPQPGAQKVEITPAQTFQLEPVPAADVAGPQGPTGSEYTSCMITQPQPQQSFYAPTSVAVTLQLSPALRSGDHVQVTVDGQSATPVDDTGIDFQIDMPYRGQHVVSAKVLDPAGKTVCVTQAVVFYVQRPSLLSPHAPANGHGVAPTAAGR